ncbi:ATPase, T2SS/T4P/T4SS family [Mesobacillus sp.]|uniref:ATPase, T2SS/T4P/T4SS family n=1 Tax=Mesobacillus sp. TaxID=2675271 RepID=UPI0039EEC184
MRSVLTRSANLTKYQTELSKHRQSLKDHQTFSYIVDTVNEILIDRYNEKIERKRLSIILPKVRQIIVEKGFYIPGIPVDALAQHTTEALTGYGRIHQLIANKEINNITIHDYRKTYIMQNLKWRPLHIDFGNPSNLDKYIRRVVSRLGGRFTLANPIANVEDEDFNLRIRATGFDISPDSPKLYIRRLSKDILKPDQVRYAMSESVEEFLKFCIKSRFNIGVAGTYGSGKTSILALLLSWASPLSHIALIQSANEIQNVHPYMSRLFTRDLVGEKANAISESNLLTLTKQITPQVLALGELLDEAAHTLLHLLQQGVQSLYTYHADDPTGAINAYNYMVQMAASNQYSEERILMESAKYNDIMIIMDRLRAREIVQFTGEIKNGMPQYETLFSFNISEETQYELKGEWKKEPGSVLCEKLQRKASLAGARIPSEFKPRVVVY